MYIILSVILIQNLFVHFACAAGQTIYYDVSFEKLGGSPSPLDRYRFAIGHNLQPYAEYNGTYDSISEVHVLGGRHPEGWTLNDGWVYSVAQRSWSKLNLTFGFEGSCSVAFGTAIYVGGGDFCFNQSCVVGKTLWKYNTTDRTFTNLTQIDMPNLPSSTVECAINPVTKDMYLVQRNILLVINLVTLASYKRTTTGDLPYPQDYSLSYRLNGNVAQLVAFGGYNHNLEFEFSNDIHVLDIHDDPNATLKWSILHPSKNSPLPERRSSVAADIIRIQGQDQLIVYGGYNYNTSHPVVEFGYFNDIWAFTFHKMNPTWRKLPPNIPDAPARSSMGSLFYAGRLLFFGGTSYNYTSKNGSLWQVAFNFNCNFYTTCEECLSGTIPNRTNVSTGEPRDANENPRGCGWCGSVCVPGDHFGVYDGDCVNYFSVQTMCGTSRYKLIFIIVASIFISIALMLCIFCAYSFWCSSGKNKSQYKKISEKKPMVN